MNLLVEITMYPLHDEHMQSIDDFLVRLNAAEGVEVKTGRMSTLLYGEHGTVMDLLKEAMAASHAEDGASAAFVLKIIPGAPRTLNGYS